MLIIKFLKESGLLIKAVSETIKNKAKEQKGGLLDMLFSKLGASLLGNLLTGKGVKAKISGRAVMRVGKGTIRADEGTMRTGKGMIRADEETMRAGKGRIRADQQTTRAGKETIRAN